MYTWKLCPSCHPRTKSSWGCNETQRWQYGGWQKDRNGATRRNSQGDDGYQQINNRGRNIRYILWIGMQY